MKSPVFVIGFVAALLAASATMLLRPAAADYPSVPATDTLAPVAAHLTSHYIEHLPVKPKTNDELLYEYVRAYKNFEKALTEADANNYDVELVGEKKPE